MILLYIVAGYLAFGFLFAIAFLIRLIRIVDEGVAKSPWTFRLMILPGCIVFWPALLNKYLKAINGINK